MRALVVLCVVGAGALQYEAAALRRALGAAKPLRNGAVIFRREWRVKAGAGAAADAVYDALTRGRGPESVAAADGEPADARAKPPARATADAPANTSLRASDGAVFAAGAVSGVVSRTATAPLDRLKMLMQVGGGCSSAGVSSRAGVVSGLRSIYERGGFFSFPAAGRAQIFALCGLVELAWWPANNYSGDYGCGFFGTSYNDDPETKATKLNAELANGRLAMLGIAGAMFAEGQTGETLAQQFENLSFSIV